MEIIDISLPIYEGMPVYPGTAKTQIKEVKSGSGASLLSEIFLTSHAGTHIDAPLHALAGAPSLDQIDLTIFYGQVRVLDLSNSGPDIKADELKPKNIKAGERILFKTSNSQRGFKEFYEDYIYLSAEAAKFLGSLGIKLVGIDALSVKKRGDKDNTSHMALLERGIPIIEGLNLSKVAEGPYTLCAFPLALQSDGAPTRAVLIK